jgi:DNA-binding response OmpR family regulator
MSTAVLVNEPEPDVRWYLERHLRRDGFELVAGPGRLPDVVLAHEDEDLERWRGEAPVIVLGREQANTFDRVRAFRRGCDDYVPRPFEYEELVERIRAVLRRSRPVPREVVSAGPLEIDLRTREARVNGVRLAVSAKEFALLLRLAGDPARVFTKEELLRDIWGFTGPTRTRTLDSHASRLRRKLRALDPVTPWIDNEWGVGYRLLAPIGGD